jgi:VanZ family protein
VPKLQWFRLLPALGWFGLVAYFSLLPHVEVPDVLNQINDKLIHFGIYAVGTMLLLRAVPTSLWRVCIASVIAFGIGIELIQALWVDGRSGDPLDVVANTMGTATAWWAIRRWMQ